MTEAYAIEDGRLTVERVEGKSNVDVDLAQVTGYHYERGVRKDTTGALVLHVEGATEPVVVRVDSEDAAEAITRLRDELTLIEVEKNKRLNEDGDETPAERDADEFVVAQDSAEELEARGETDGHTEDA